MTPGVTVLGENGVDLLKVDIEGGASEVNAIF